MTETGNISRMAEILSQEIFPEFGWSRQGPLNQNWGCVITDHEKETHPSDLVMFYDDPYSSERIYVNFDLKSYARDSISRAQVGGAIKSLALATECANISQSWQALYLHRDVSPRVIGLLFVYNHDGEYDKDFFLTLSDISRDNYKLRAGNRMFVLGPRDVCYLKTISNDISSSRGRQELPSRDQCSFFYPDLILMKAKHEDNIPATLEMLSSPWQILCFRHPSTHKDQAVLYLRSRGDSIDEFLYIIDYFFQYQLIQKNERILIRHYDPDPNASVNFERATHEYNRHYGGGGTLDARISKIGYSSITSMHTRFSEIAIGMEQ